MQRFKQNSQSNPVKVFIRIRPFLEEQYQANRNNIVQNDQQHIRITDDKKLIQMKFDRVFDAQQTQRQFYEIFRHEIPKVFRGQSVTILAYGQTGSGKTFTMFGRNPQILLTQYDIFNKKIDYDQNNIGITLRAIYNLFMTVPTKETDNYTIYCSFFQIYNQKIYDLFESDAKMKSLQIHQDKHEGIFIQGLSEFQINTFYDCYKLINKALTKRFIRQTSKNNRSSRSHSVFQLLIQYLEDHKYVKKSRLNLCDLAGSEKINKNEIMNEDHIKQLKSINQSLSALGKVIYNISSGGKNISVFRQSKLTRVLQNSLTYNTHTFIIGNVSPSKLQKQETLNTLRFLQRAKKINVKIKTIAETPNNNNLVAQLQQEVIKLKKQLKVYPENNLHKKMQDVISENQKLRYTRLNSKEISNILEQNRKMKLIMDNIHQKQLSNRINDEDQFFSNNNFQINIFPADLKKRSNIYRDTYNNQGEDIRTVQYGQVEKYNNNFDIDKILEQKKLRSLSLNEKYNRRQKSRIVERLIELEKIQKINQQKLSREIQAINSEKYPRDVQEKKIASSAQEISNYKKMMNYERKIKELEARLIRNS